MKYTAITKRDASINSIKPLYESAFPLSERRYWTEVIKLLDEPLMKLITFHHLNVFIGFVITWQLKEWTYIEHLAVKPLQRGKGFGQQVMKHLLAISKGNLILETELPAAENSINRISFYERSGLQQLPYAYVQPPYRRNDVSVPMILMSSQPFNNIQEYHELVNFVRREVYERSFTSEFYPLLQCFFTA